MTKCLAESTDENRSWRGSKHLTRYVDGVLGWLCNFGIFEAFGLDLWGNMYQRGPLDVEPWHTQVRPASPHGFCRVENGLVWDEQTMTNYHHYERFFLRKKHTFLGLCSQDYHTCKFVCAYCLSVCCFLCICCWHCFLALGALHMSHHLDGKTPFRSAPRPPFLWHRFHQAPVATTNVRTFRKKPNVAEKFYPPGN